MVLWGSGASLKEVWAAADMALGLMTVVNVTALALLTPTIVAVSKDYFRKRDQGLSMEFKQGDCQVQGKPEAGIWS
jgi:AGCS family alanine or glycine:cation symporter